MERVAMEKAAVWMFKLRIFLLLLAVLGLWSSVYFSERARNAREFEKVFGVPAPETEEDAKSAHCRLAVEKKLRELAGEAEEAREKQKELVLKKQRLLREYGRDFNPQMFRELDQAIERVRWEGVRAFNREFKPAFLLAKYFKIPARAADDYFPKGD